jgi:hypothetical protein
MKSSTPFLGTALIFSLLIISGIGACDIYSDGGGDKEQPPQTRIIDVLVEPDTVAPGDTASFTCVIEDSLDTRFKFYWYVDTGQILDAELFDDNPVVYETNVNDVLWVAPQELGFNSFSVRVNNGAEDSVSVKTSFVIVVE